MTEKEARKALEDLGLQVGTVSTEYSDTVEEGKVIEQSELAGKDVLSGTTVDFWVSLGVKEILYMLNAKISLPPNGESVIAANITLEDADGNVLETWTDVAAEDFPYQIRVENITTDSGLLRIEWLSETEEGEVTSDIQELPAPITQQN